MFIVDNIDKSLWMEFLQNCGNSTIYHTPYWKKLLEETFGYRSYYIFVKNDNEELIGMLPLCHIKSRPTGSRLCCLPFAHDCGFVGDIGARDLVISEIFRLFDILKLDYVEIRSLITDDFHKSNNFSTYILPISNDVGQIWNKLDKGSVRWAIKKAEKQGVHVESSTNTEDVREFYELNCLTKKDLGVPGHTLKFFKNLFEFPKCSVKLYTVRQQGRAIGGGIMIYFRDVVLYGYGAAHPNYLRSYPYNAFLWKAIEDACLNGFKNFDFGRASYDNVGLINFKERWGTEERRLYYCFYPKNPGSITEKRDSLKYRLAARTIRRLPIMIYKRFSDAVLGSFG